LTVEFYASAKSFARWQHRICQQVAKCGTCVIMHVALYSVDLFQILDLTFYASTGMGSRSYYVLTMCHYPDVSCQLQHFNTLHKYWRNFDEIWRR